VPRAVEELESSFGHVLVRAAARIDAPNADEIAQTVRERVFVREGGRPARILEYAGRAKLASWLAAVATREALGARRKRGGGGKDFESLSGVAAAAPLPAPEIEILRARYGDEFRAAVRAALARATPEARAVLRMNLVLGLSIDRIAPVYGWSRATAARRLAAAREALHVETKQELVARLKLAPTEIDSLVAVMRSQLDVSVAGLLSDADVGKPSPI
jgi:RNA polymerase sigma-70 factor (ECF subfamily)